MNDIVISFHNHSHVKVATSTESIFYELRDYFSFEVEGAKFNPKFRYGGWNGRINLLEFNGLLPYGLVSQVKTFASNMEYSVFIDPDIIPQPEFKTNVEFDEWINSKKIYSGGTQISPHWYQKDAVFEAINNKRKILNLPTSAGKSLIQCLLSLYYLENYEGKVLILVPTTALVDQMKADFVDYGLFPAAAIGQLRGGKKPSNDQLIVVSTWQTAIKQDPEWFEQFGMLLCDEMHLAVGKSITTIINRLAHCPFKIGLSGSLRDGKANIMQYVGLFGEIFKPVSTAQLMEDGQVTDLKINVIDLKYPEAVQKAIKGKTYQEEIKFITGSKKRVDWIAKLSLGLAKRNENSFVMFKNIAHGKAIYEKLKESHDKVFYVSGEVDTDTRNALKAMAESDTGIIVVASYGVFSTGISVKNLHHVVLAHPVKSKVIILQTIGRVLRKHDSKSKANVWDIIDDMAILKKQKDGTFKRTNHNYALKHGLERIERYASERFDYSIKAVNIQ